MALPLTGPMSLTMIQGEFGGPTPIALQNYYRGGAYVPDSATNAAIPTSGPLPMQSFYGAAQGISVVLTAGENIAQDITGWTITGEVYGSLNPPPPLVINGSTTNFILTSTAAGGTSLFIDINGLHSQNFFDSLQISGDDWANGGPFSYDLETASATSFTQPGGRSQWGWEIAPASDVSMVDGFPYDVLIVE